MERKILLRVGELALKTGRPRAQFERSLLSNLSSALSLRKIQGKVSKEKSGRIIARVAEEDSARAIDALSKVFGIVSLSPVEEIEYSGLADLVAAAAARVDSVGKNFAIRASRAGKLAFDSQELAVAMGNAVSEKFPQVTVKLTNPETEIFVEARAGSAYLFFRSIPGAGGLPYGVEGKALAVLDGSIRAAVAAAEIAKRGCSLVFAASEEVADGAAIAAASISDFLPKERIDIILVPQGKGFRDAAKDFECAAIVTGSSGGEAPLESPGIPTFSPLLFLSEEEIVLLEKKYLGGRDAAPKAERRKSRGYAVATFRCR